ncbi:hypothetical protein F4780DRAFT_675604 [Xylariomycetidae sp. FL0641]|nr:hypothetical protein F4780DRAFT_675604 [Xylariomycetidae sp. FL0641]
MPSLLDFPVEVLLHIIKSVDPIDRSTFHALSLTSRTMNALVTPVMYHTVAFESATARCRAPIPAFIRTITSSKPHASMVKAFAVNKNACSCLPGIDDLDYLKDVCGEAAYKSDIWRVWETHLARQKEMIDDQMSRYLELLAPLFLPNLNTLLLDGYTGDGIWDFLRRILEDSSASQIWPELNEVILEGTVGAYPDQSWPLALFGRLPQVKRIHGSTLGDEIEQDHTETGALFRSMKPGHSGLQEITLERTCQLDSYTMDRLLEAPEALKVFKYNLGHPWAYTDINTTRLQKSLDYQSHSLEEISLTISSVNFDRSSNLGDVIKPMSFSEFEALKTLEVSPPFVFGDEALRHAELHPGAPDSLETDIELSRRQLLRMLPRSVQTIRFAQCGLLRDVQKLDCALTELFERKSQDFPDLQNIEIHAPALSKTNAEWPSELQRSAWEARRRGIRMTAYSGGRLGHQELLDDRLRISRVARNMHERFNSQAVAVELV